MVDPVEPESFLRPVNIASSLFFESAVEIFQRVYREIRPRAEMPAIEVAYKRFANADSRVRLADGVIRVAITDLLESAPAPVVEALLDAPSKGRYFNGVIRGRYPYRRIRDSNSVPQSTEVAARCDR